VLLTLFIPLFDDNSLDDLPRTFSPIPDVAVHTASISVPGRDFSMCSIYQQKTVLTRSTEPLHVVTMQDMMPLFQSDGTLNDQLRLCPKKGIHVRVMKYTWLIPFSDHVSSPFEPLTDSTTSSALTSALSMCFIVYLTFSHMSFRLFLFFAHKLGHDPFELPWT
jgi:hypothetical protein